ncbi:MAG: PAS domain S-box protein, partial [Verrucomicrobiota bacterium]
MKQSVAVNEVLLFSALEQSMRAETERRHADVARSLLASIVESSADSIISINFDAIITSWNQAAELLYGYRAEEVLGKSLALLTLPEDLKEVLARIDKVKHSKSVELFETERVGANGVPIFLSVQLSPIKNAQGQVMGVSTIARNITRRKKVEEALEISRQKISEHAEQLEQQIAERIADLKTTNEQLESFVYTIAHDLRAPLRAMQGFSQALLEDYAPTLDEMARNYLSRINNSSEFMDKMIIDLLAFGRAGRLEVE